MKDAEDSKLPRWRRWWHRLRGQRLQSRDARRRLQLLLDHMPDGVIAFDAAGQVEWINPAARLIFQRGAANSVGRPITRLLPDIDAVLTQAEVPPLQGPAPAQAPRHVLDGLRRDGTRVALEVALVLWTDPRGRREGMCVCRDLSESQRIDRMKREFVTMVSHELRTPLTSLRGALSLLADGSFTNLPKDVTRLLTLASNNSERLVMLVNDILDFERLRSGALRVDSEPLDLHVVATQALADLEGLAAQQQVHLLLLDAPSECPVLADPQRLTQVLGNLLSNAIKHSPPGGTVLVDVAPRAERWRLTVKDSGLGVPDELLPRLFEPFEQARDPRLRKPGTGLGLAISRALMEMMQGAIGLEPPRPGRGAAFWIELPSNSERPSTFGP